MARKLVIALVLVVLAAVSAGAWVFLRHPLALLAWTGRRALAGAGLSRTSWETPAGRQTGFRGGKGPLLVLLHGAGDQAGSWSRVAPRLAERFRVVALDLAGHGGSEPLTGPISVGTVLAGLDGVLEREAEAGPAILVGNSLGAWVAFLEAHRRPERVVRVVAIDGGPLTGSSTAAVLLPATREEARLSVAQTRDPGSLRVPDHVLDDIVRQAREGPLGRVAATAPEMGRFVLDGRLSEVRVPVSLVWGESDRLLPLDYARRVQAGLPAATLTTIPSCGHVPQVECPVALLDALEPILSAPVPASPPGEP